MGLEVRRVANAGIPALVTPGEVTDDDLAKVNDRFVHSIAIDGRSYRHPGASLSWVAQLPRVHSVFILGAAKSPDLSTLPESVSELFVMTSRAEPVDSRQLAHFDRIHSESESFSRDGYVNLPRLSHLFVGRVRSQEISIGDGCDSLTYLKMRGTKQVARVVWSRAPRSLRTFMTHDLYWSDVRPLSGCAHLESLQVYNAAVRTGVGSLDLAPLSACKELTLINAAENLPQTGLSPLLKSNPTVVVQVAKDMHDGPTDDRRLHVAPARVKEG